MMSGNLMNVVTVMTTRMSAAPTVHQSADEGGCGGNSEQTRQPRSRVESRIEAAARVSRVARSRLIDPVGG